MKLKFLFPLLVLLATAMKLNADESALPDPLVAADGKPVTAADWPRRREELLELFRREVFGRNPVERPADMTCTVTQVVHGALGGMATCKSIRIAYGGPGGKGGIDLQLFVPAERSGAVPCFLYISGKPTASSTSWHPGIAVARGFATAAFYVGDVDPDQDDGFKDGAHGIFDAPGVPRGPDAWGTIAAWAWAASRCIDYLVTDGDVDAKHIAVAGHSRYGKTALWCGAQDIRVALTISNNSGCTGAAVSRNKRGEDVAAINGRFPHWFCVNYRRWNGREGAMPFDQHELIALCAPRMVYVASATEDAWADPAAEFRGCVAASPAWELQSLRGLTSKAMPGPEQPLGDGCIGYHLRTGKHSLAPYDWDRFIDFARNKSP